MVFRLRNLFRAGSAPAAPRAFAQALDLIQRGQLEHALLALQALLNAEPGHAEGWYKQGNVLKDLRRPHEALASYQRAIEFEPRHTGAHCNSGVVLLNLGRTDEALRAFDQTIAIDPQDAIAYYNRGVAEQTLELPAAAFLSYAKALEFKPDYAEAHFSRARLYEQASRWHEALCDHDRALALRPGFVQAHFHRGNVLTRLDRWDEATASYERVIGLEPDHSDAHFNRGVVFELLKRFPEALRDFERAIAIRPEFVAAHYNRALVQLQTGDYGEGFSNYEWRWKNRSAGFDPAAYHGDLPRWSGQESLRGKRILIFSEQGLGDTLQFCRYLPLLAGLGAKVVFEVQPPLAELLANIDGASAVIARGQSVPTCDWKCPLMSLPLAFKTTIDTVPAARKYLHAEASSVAVWQGRLGPRTRPRIGLAWSGNVQNPSDHRRSIPLAALIEGLPPEFEYFCLQTDIRAEDRMTLDASPFIAEPGADLAGTAALCECMDVVISSCTSIAHLAGALGRPLWVLLAFNADWRWLEYRHDSPWYPTAKLYRQAVRADWGGVVARVAAELRRTFAPPDEPRHTHRNFARDAEDT